MRDCVGRILRTVDALRDDRSGHTLGILAAALIPIAGLVGGGIDMSRAYMAKTQLQAACDAGALAGRRALAQTDEYGEDEKAKALRLFRANFDGDRFGVDQPTFNSAPNGEDDIEGDASIDMPTVVMNLFNINSIPIDVECMAELQVSNTDVMFVLDTTGSMAGDRITGLRQAIRDFHSTLATADLNDGTRVRYGFVPYVQSVNAGDLLADGHLPESYFSASTNYQTRVAVFDNEDTVTTYGELVPVNTYTERLDDRYIYTEGYCRNWAGNFGNSPVNNGNESTSYELLAWTYVRSSGGRDFGHCDRTVTESEREEFERTIYRPTRYIFRQDNLDTSEFRGRGIVEFASSLSASNSWVETEGTYDMVELAQMQDNDRAGGITTDTSSWNGCLMERRTEASETFDPIPSNADDHDLLTAPVDGQFDTQWRPIWRDVVYRTNGSKYTSSYDSSYYACPARMVPFTTIDMSSTDVPTWLGDYIDDEITAFGGTYHDIGMIWGGRLSSPRGIMAANVNDQPNRPTGRHIIFMTDGRMDAQGPSFSAYGIEQYEHRVAPSGTSNDDLNTRHAERFKAACTSAKAEGITVWVIGFGTTVTADMRACASGDRWYFASDTTQLRNTFRTIASQVADLRLGA